MRAARVSDAFLRTIRFAQFGLDDPALGSDSEFRNPRFADHPRQQFHAFVEVGGRHAGQVELIDGLGRGGLGVRIAAKGHPEPLPDTLGFAVGDMFGTAKGQMFEQMRMASEDSLVMTVHPAVVRNHHTGTFERFGADVGGDIPMQIEVVRALQPGLNAFGTHPNFRIILFGMDETVYSREVGPLAGFYPSVYVGPPWWFIDAPDAIKRWRKSVTEYGTFYKTCGFIDDTRAFMSIPARHDVARRCDVSHLAELVVEGRLELDEAEQTAFDLTSTLPRKAFNIPS